MMEAPPEPSASTGAARMGPRVALLLAGGHCQAMKALASLGVGVWDGVAEPLGPEKRVGLTKGVVLVNPTAASSDLIDENSLLEGEDFSEGKAVTAGGCAPKRKACANCSCG